MRAASARVGLWAVLPAELVLALLLVAGVTLPTPVIVGAELTVAAVLVLEAVTAYRLFAAERRGGMGRRAAARAVLRRLLPVEVRRLMGFEVRGAASLALYVARRRHGVPAGATAVPYAREQAPLLVVLLFLTAAEAVVAELVLRELGAPAGLRAVVLAVGLYAIVVGMAIGAACVTRPHVVSTNELRIRYGAFFDLRIPRERIRSVRLARNHDESNLVTVRDGRLAVAVSSQTNVVVELTGPVVAVRPLGRRVEATTVCFFADDPDSAVTALQRCVGADTARGRAR